MNDMIYIDIDRVQNSTLAKLTYKEIGELGLLNAGVCTYKGELKTRYNGVKRQTSDNKTFWYEGTNGLRVEFTEIVAINNEGVKEWAARIYDTKAEKYSRDMMGVYGCNFFR